MKSVFSRIAEDIKNGTSTRTEVVGFVVSVFAFLSHVCFLPLFYFLKVKQMFVFNIFSVTFFGTIMFTYKKKESYLFQYLASTLEVITHQICACYYIGVSSSFHYYILLMALIGSLMINKKEKLSAILSLICCAFFLTVEISMSGITPVYTINPVILKWIKIFNIGLSLFVVVVIEYAFTVTVCKAEKKAAEQFERANSLLSNTLPVHIINRMNRNPKEVFFADSYTSASVLVMDIVSFTEYSSQLDAKSVVTLLDSLFSQIDSVIDSYHVEKIKTHGDNYVAATGIPNSDENSYKNIALFALKIIDIVENFNKSHNTNCQLRIGIHCGPLIAGVIGKKKYTYDLWGSTVTFAYRMNSTDIPGRIQVSREFYEKLADEFIFDERAPVPVKSYGMKTNFFLIGIKN